MSSVLNYSEALPLVTFHMLLQDIKSNNSTKWRIPCLSTAFKIWTVSSRQYHVAEQEFKAQWKPQTSLISSCHQYWYSYHQFRNPTTENAAHTTYRVLTYCTDWSSHKGKCVSTYPKYYSASQNIWYLPRDMGKITGCDKHHIFCI